MEYEMSYQAKRFKSKHRSNKSASSRSCRSKVRFRSREHAVEALIGFRYQAMRNQQDGVEFRIPVRAYQCPEFECHGGWHLTSKSDHRSISFTQSRSAWYGDNFKARLNGGVSAHTQNLIRFDSRHRNRSRPMGIRQIDFGAMDREANVQGRYSTERTYLCGLKQYPQELCVIHFQTLP